VQQIFIRKLFLPKKDDAIINSATHGS
jgi:hypothetical protein